MNIIKKWKMLKKDKFLKIYQFVRIHVFLFIIIFIKLIDMHIKNEKFTVSSIFKIVIVIAIAYAISLWIGKKDKPNSASD